MQQHHQAVEGVLAVVERRPGAVLPLVQVADSSPGGPLRGGVLPVLAVGLRPQPVELVLEGLQRLVELASVPASEPVEHQFGLVELAFGLAMPQFVLAFLLAPEGLPLVGLQRLLRRLYVLLPSPLQ